MISMDWSKKILLFLNKTSRLISRLHRKDTCEIGNGPNIFRKIEQDAKLRQQKACKLLITKPVVPTMVVIQWPTTVDEPAKMNFLEEQFS